MNILCFGGGMVGIAAALENIAISAPLVLIAGCALQGASLLGAYVLSRFYGMHRVVVWPVMLLVLAFICLLNFYNAGSYGGAQYFYFICAFMGAILLQGWQRILIIALYVAAVNILLFIEYNYPGLLVEYRSPEDRYFDIAFSYTLCLVLFGLIVAVVSAHYHELLRRTTRQQDAFKEDLHLARELQRRVIQVLPENLHGLDAAVSYRPAASLGGDFYEVHPFEDGLRILIADVTGHGINAALSSMLAKGEWAQSKHLASPADALMDWNKSLCRDYRDAMTLSACVVDLHLDGSVRYASAGHGLQHVLSSSVLRILPATGILLGLDPVSRIIEQGVPASENVRIVLFTDALYEETDGQGVSAGVNWLSDLVRKHPGPAADLVRDIESAFGRRTGRAMDELADDLTIVVVEKGRFAAAR